MGKTLRYFSKEIPDCRFLFISVRASLRLFFQLAAPLLSSSVHAAAKKKTLIANKLKDINKIRHNKHLDKLSYKSTARLFGNLSFFGITVVIRELIGLKLCFFNWIGRHFPRATISHYSSPLNFLRFLLA